MTEPSRPMELIRFRPWHKVVVWWKARILAPKHLEGTHSATMTEPAIVQIHQWTEERLHRTAAVWGHRRHSIAATLEQTVVALSRANDELSKREKIVTSYEGQYERNHEGMKPVGTRGQARESPAFWMLGVFAAAEWPLMSAALNLLPIPDWQRFLATAGASVVIICLSHQIGVGFAKPCRTIWQTIFGWLLVAVLGTILTAAAIVRHEVIRDREKSPVNTTPEVRFDPPKGNLPHHV